MMSIGLSGDGRLIVQGQNPFDQLPAFYLEAGHEVKGLSTTLFEQLNSPEYFTIYPPVAQASFAVGLLVISNEHPGQYVGHEAFFTGL